MKLSEYGVTDKPISNGQRWLIFFSIFFMAFLASYNLFKAAPAIQFIAADLQMSPASVSQIMGAYSIPAVVLAFPAMWLAQKLGFKFSALLSGALMIVGSLFCASVSTAGMFLFGRVLEGFGYGLVSIIGPNMVPRLFPRNKIGLSMGIWSQWLPAGTMVSFFLTPVIFGAAGGAAVPYSWHAMFYFAIVLEAISFLLVLFFFKQPAVNESAVVDSNPNLVIKKEGKNYMASAMIIAFTFFVWAYLYVANVNSFYPAFLQSTHGMTMWTSSMLTNVAAIISVVFGIAFGVVADKKKIRKPLIVLSYLMGAVAFAFCLWGEGGSLAGPVIGILLMGFGSAMIGTCTRAILTTLLSTPKKTDFALTCMGFAMALGKLVGGYTVSPSLVAFGYQGSALYICVPLAIIAAVLVAVFVKSDKHVRKQREAELEAVRMDAEQAA